MNKATTNLHALRAGLVVLACIAASSCLHAAITCDINSAALTFGMYDPSSNSPTDGVGTVELRCTNFDLAAASGVNVALTISPYSNRKMTGNGYALLYGVYGNSARTANWGDGATAPMLSTGAMQANETKSLRFTLYGRIPPLQNVGAGNYADSLQIVVTP